MPTVNHHHTVIFYTMIYRRFLLLAAILFGVINLNAQDKTALSYANQLDSLKIKTHLTTLASDAFLGRGANEKGGEMAVSYIVEALKKSGVKSGNGTSYLQDIEAQMQQANKNASFLFQDFDYKRDFSYSNSMFQDSIITSDEVLFVGYGKYSKSYNDFAGLDINGKIIMKMYGEPTSRFGIPYAVDDQSSDYMKAAKPKAILSVSTSRYFGSSYYGQGSLVFKYGRYIDGEQRIPEIEISEVLANKLLEPSGKSIKQIVYEVESSGSSPSLTIEKPVRITGANRYDKAQVYNVIGIIEGSSDKDEYVVLAAHYDHLGNRYGDVFNGADDNASGVSALLEVGAMLAKAKKEGKGPKRTVILLFPGAEESGLCGSTYYVNEPVFPLEKTVACVNIDMIGRVDSKYDNSSGEYLYVVNRQELSGTLPLQLRKVNNRSLNLTLDFEHSDNYYMFRQSDNAPFADKRIPSISLTTGEHKDYHRITDDSDLIDYKNLYKRAQLIFLLAMELADPSAAVQPIVEPNEVEVSEEIQIEFMMEK